MARMFARGTINQPDFQNNLWTLMASGVVSAFNFVIKLIVVRLFGLADAGIFSFAVAVAALSCVLVLFGVRAFQSTDIRQEYSLNSYIGLRVCTTMLSVVAVTVFIIANRFEASRAIVIFLVCIFYWSDAFADVFMGDLQQKGNMRIAGRMRVSAFLSGAVVFGIISFMSRSLIFSLISAVVTINIIYTMWIWVYRSQFKKVHVKLNITAIKKLTTSTLPFMIAGIFGTFLIMGQTFFLSFLHTDESVAVFTILMMPLSVLTILANSFFLGAEMTKTAKIYESGQIEHMAKRINKQFLLAVIVSVFTLLCAYLFGIPFLSWLYNIDLSLYMRDFMLLATGSILLMLFPILGAALTVFRKQRAWMIISIVIAVIVAPINWFLVERHEIVGAVFATLNIHMFLATAAYILYRISLRKCMLKLDRAKV